MTASMNKQSTYADFINSGKAVPIGSQPNRPPSTAANFSVNSLASRGRNGDTQLAHVTPGEVVIPKEVAALRPDLVAHVSEQIRAMGGNPNTTVVGNGRNNPATGIQEFATQAEVTAAYQNTLGRAPDAAGLAAWMAAPDLSGFKAAAAPEIAQNVTNAYTATLGRAPDAAGAANWAANYNPTTFTADFKTAAAPEIAARPTAPAPVVLPTQDRTKATASIQQAYQNNFGRPAEQAGIDSWLQQGASNPNFDYNTAIKSGAQGADLNALADISAGGVDTSKTWGVGANLTTPALTYDSANNTWGTGEPKAPTPKPIAAATYNATQLGAPVKWNVTPEQTVAGQIQTNLASGSPIMQLAETQGLQRANSRGLLNSSMAVGAAQDSMVSAALPIAQADATANLGVNRYNVDTPNQFATTNAASDNAAKSFGAQQTNATNQFNTSLASQTDQFNTSNEVAKQAAAQLNTDKVTAANFEANVKASLAQITNEQNFNLQTQQVVGTMANDFMKAMQQINQDTNMNQQSKDYSINQLFGSLKSSISLISAVGSVPNVATLLINGGPQ